MRKLEIKRGDKYGRLTILNEVEGIFNSKDIKMRNFLCLCTCGKKLEILLNNLRMKKTISCGCFRTERIVKFLKDGGHYKKHGMYGNPEYVSWNSMKNHHNKEICSTWLNFEGFFKDMGKRPEGMILGRINVNKKYEKNNCKWMTQVEHAPKRENHSCWIKDRTQLKKSDRNSKSTACVDWKKNIYKRDDWKCKINNKDCKGSLEAHHILTWIDYPELRYDINNGITLCHFHHPRKKNEVIELSPYFKGLIELTKN